MEPRQLNINEARETLVREHSLWQMEFLKPDDLNRFASDRGLTVAGRQIGLLWEVGLVRADIIISNQPPDMAGVREIFVEGTTHYCLDERIPMSGHEEWLNRGLEPTIRPLTPYFHPSRYDVLHHLLRVFDLSIMPLQPLHSVEGYYRLVTHLIEH